MCMKTTTIVTLLRRTSVYVNDSIALFFVDTTEDGKAEIRILPDREHSFVLGVGEGFGVEVTAVKNGQVTLAITHEDTAKIESGHRSFDERDLNPVRF